jgi:hypothetical protein
MESLNLLINEAENVAGRVAVLEPGEKWVREDLLPCAFSIGFQGIIENQFQVMGVRGERLTRYTSAASPSIMRHASSHPSGNG